MNHTQNWKLPTIKHLRIAGAAVLLAAIPQLGLAHCDSLDGPVIKEARKALELQDVTPTLKWVPAAHEPLIREAFERAIEVREMGGKAAELADLYFFETLVRIHREGEGAAYTGLRPVGTLEPLYHHADEALLNGKGAELAEHLARTLQDTLQERYETAIAKLGEAENSVEAGREFVEAYVEYMHTVEGLHALIEHGGHHAHE